ncbi:hypothetical protein ASPCADRAFT_130010 [Aspergillus carbonarius ITEM 5010]|uniref:Uncharacterized protein n=1 Tax=Aspergillus carbonarius (strain ITEM 5010) TaxID=602072 RepID=A0A1R3RMH0_ASPC5|nr:hypothetical protein ASPCADRAFT_129962 [Aspergillus carbonarius ITEM 5010]OOF95674.1 hypothetical protein ASPCADRAFT_130010 [Aspergillus carbonarius ITEM 5010]
MPSTRAYMAQIVRDNDTLIARTLPFRASDQQINISIGTFFAFLVKALLAMTISTVFDQSTWGRLLHGPTRKIGIIDDLFSAHQNRFQTLNLRLWRNYPMSMILATII